MEYNKKCFWNKLHTPPLIEINKIEWDIVLFTILYLNKNTLPKLWFHESFLNMHFLLLSRLQHGIISPVTVGNQQHPSVLYLCCALMQWGSRWQWSHTNPLKSFFSFSHFYFHIFVSLFPLPSSSPSSLILFFLSFSLLFTAVVQWN